MPESLPPPISPSSMDLVRQMATEAASSASELDEWQDIGFDSGSDWHQGRTLYAVVYPEIDESYKFELPEGTVESGMLGYIKRNDEHNYVLIDGRVIREQNGQKYFLEDKEINDLASFLASYRQAQS